MSHVCNTWRSHTHTHTIGEVKIQMMLNNRLFPGQERISDLGTIVKNCNQNTALRVLARWLGVEAFALSLMTEFCLQKPQR